jgi:hypothetical protein
MGGFAVAQELTQQFVSKNLDLHLPLWLSFRRIIRSGCLKIRDWNGEVREFGDGSGPLVFVRFNDRALATKLILDPNLAFRAGG